MKVIVLGGGGGMGAIAATLAARHDFVDQLVVADIDIDAARHVAAAIGNPATAVAVDVADTRELVSLLGTGDVVLNTVGPYFRFGVPILRAAIGAGIHCLDICDDWEPTIDMLALDRDAADAGITAVVGLGASPGLSNLLAMSAMRHLDEVDSVVTGWGLDDDDAAAAVVNELDHAAESGTAESGLRHAPSAAMVHWVQQFSGMIRVWADGGHCDFPALERHELDYPGIGPTEVWTVGHPEALTIPRARPELRSCLNVMAISRDGADLLAGIADDVTAGRTTVEAAAAELSQHLSHPDRAAAALASPLPKVFAVASGSVAGRHVRCAATITARPGGGMAGATSVPLVIGLDLLHSGLVAGPGVRTPEEVVPPEEFFDRYARFCEPPIGSGSQLVEITMADDHATADGVTGS